MDEIPAKREAEEQDILVPFEQAVLPSDYKQYYSVKKQNMFASIQNFSEHWHCYVLLDQIFLREFEDLNVATSPNRAFPLVVYFNAHAKVRISFELALSGCLSEARSMLRDAIECVAHAHHMLKDPKLQLTWIGKLQDEDAFEEAFIANKKKGLFEGLEELHRQWGQLSETGSHSTIMAICDRVLFRDEADGRQMLLRYAGAEPEWWSKSLLSLLLTFFTIENTLFSDYRERLQFDEQLLKMREDLNARKERLRHLVIRQFKIAPPIVVLR